MGSDTTKAYIYYTCDTEKPIVTGLEAGKTYCRNATFRVSDANLRSVSYQVGSNAAVTLIPDADGNYGIVAWEADLKNLTVIAEDTSGNRTEVKNITVNMACTQEADDGDCTTDILCKYCGNRMVAGAYTHTWSTWTSDGNQTTHSRHCTTPGCKRKETEKCDLYSMWVTGSGKYWKECTVCEQETDKKVCPEKITLQGADKVCYGQDYTATFTLPEGLRNPGGVLSSDAYEDGLTVTNLGNGVYAATVKAESLQRALDIGDTKVDVTVVGYTEDGYGVLTVKTIEIQGEHTGGTPTCTDKASCEVCGKAYGEVDANHHAELKHMAAKSATAEAEGNIEYWYCADCGKYFNDKGGEKEIRQADTVIAKLASPSPKTGDHNQVALWAVLLVLSGGAVITLAVFGKKKIWTR